MKILRVGDPHAKVGNLTELKALVLFVVEQAKLHKVDQIELLGDLFHTHNVIRLEVIEFWTWALGLLADTCPTVVLVGNHDQSGDYNSDFSALTPFAMMGIEGLAIIEKPTQIGVFGYIPYIHDESKFLDAAFDLNGKGAKVLVCHQTFEGSTYESGIYAPDGFCTYEWPGFFEHVISGHIHSEQDFGNFIYPGTARWDNASDANRRKGVWIYDHEDNGKIKSSTFISTENVCSPIHSIEYREGDERAPDLVPGARTVISLIGTSTWVSQQKEFYKGKCAISVKITDKKSATVRKTGNNFEDFMKNLFVSTMDREHLLSYAKELGIV